jgi:transcriptional regulator with XRE-family HTH domain
MNVAGRFGKNLAGHRRASRMTQEELAKCVSVHRTEISTIESGRRQPRIEMLIKLAGALSIDAGDLLAGIAWVPSRTGPGHFELSGD